MMCHRLAFHDGLDFVSVHESLTEELKSALMSVRGKQSLDRQIETILHQKASAITDKKVFPLVCSSNAQRNHSDSPADIQAISSGFASGKGVVCRRHGGRAISEG
jgi:hypothetical protein